MINMEEKLEMKKTEVKEENKESGILNLTHQVIWYMLIFSVLGLLVETIYGYATTGIFESRKGLILGPFCPIYGLGAVIILLLLGRFRDHKIKLFICGAVLGCFIEYAVSFILEAMYGSRFWSYANFMNLNRRICLLYGVFWGILSVVLIQLLKPWIDKLIGKIKGKPRKIIDIVLVIFFVLDIVITVWATSLYKTRARDVYYDVKVFEEKNIFEKAGDRIFTNSLMKTIFPNLRLVDNEGNEIWIKDIIKD